MDCEPRLSSTVITAFKEEIERDNILYTRSKTCLEKLIKTRKEISKQKDNLTTELNKIKLVLENLDAQIDNKSNYQRSLSNIVKIKQNIISKLLIFNFI
jgi:hypothetical protein